MEMEMGLVWMYVLEKYLDTYKTYSVRSTLVLVQTDKTDVRSTLVLVRSTYIQTDVPWYW